jgi:7-cyano-7-deazaguanine reductase
MPNPNTDHLTALGNKIDGSLEASQLETFAAPDVDVVSFRTEEVGALCPVTMQPDLYTVEITYEPNGKCVESKTLKLYLTTFRNEGIFGEALAATIADDLYKAIEPVQLSVRTTQQIRGGLQMTTVATRG